jgi:hypothetical protein
MSRLASCPRLVALVPESLTMRLGHIVPAMICSASHGAATHANARRLRAMSHPRLKTIQKWPQMLLSGKRPHRWDEPRRSYLRRSKMDLALWIIAGADHPLGDSW